MSKDIDSIKRKLLIKYPNFGSTISRLEFIEDELMEKQFFIIPNFQKAYQKNKKSSYLPMKYVMQNLTIFLEEKEKKKYFGILQQMQ